MALGQTDWSGAKPKIPKCKNCGSRMLKGYLRLDEETTSTIWVCPRSDDLHLELHESGLFFNCTKNAKPKQRKKKAQS